MAGRIAETLLEREVLDGEEVKLLIEGHELPALTSGGRGQTQQVLRPEAGRRARVAICAVRYGYGDAAQLARWQPDYWLGNLRELVG